MKLPWNKKYLVISFHVIVTVALVAVMGLLVFQFSSAKNVVFQIARDTLAIFAPVLFGIFFSVILEPMVAFFQRRYEGRLPARKKIKVQNRKAGTILTYITLLVIVLVAGGAAVIGFGGMDVDGAAQQLSGYIRKGGDLLVLLNLKLAELGILKNVEGMLSAGIDESIGWMQAKVMNIATSLPKIGSSVMDILIGLVVAFYFLMEKDIIHIYLRNISMLFFGKTATERVRRVFLEMDRIIMNYLGGQLMDAVIMGTLFAVTFRFLGIPYGILIGVVSGFSNMIPYFGAITAFLLAVLSGLLSGETVKALYAAIAIVILQQIDGIWIVPRVVGSKVELHPVFVLLSLAVFGQLLGFWGLLVAVPLGAFVQSFFLWVCGKKMERLRKAGESMEDG